MFTLIIILLELLKWTQQFSVNHTNAGSCFFHSDAYDQKCWSQKDFARLKARQIFENLVPPEVTPEEVDSYYVNDLIKYLQSSMSEVQAVPDKATGDMLKESLADTFGAHLRSGILPTLRLAYYAGYVPLKDAKLIHDYFDGIKTLLNTQGEGWREPDKYIEWTNVSVAKIPLAVNPLTDPCSSLIVRRDSKSCIQLPRPKLDDRNNPSALALPFKHNGLVSLISPSSENILPKYYSKAAKCILRRSPRNCRHTDFVNFNNDLWHWMKADAAPHLLDEKLYAGFGGILRVGAAVQNYGRGLSRRQTFGDLKNMLPNWERSETWKYLKETNICFDKSFMTYPYFAAIMAIAVLICCVQVFYIYMFGDSVTCSCRKTWRGFGLPAPCRGGHKQSFAEQAHVAESQLQIARLRSRDLYRRGSTARPTRRYTLNECQTLYPVQMNNVPEHLQAKSNSSVRAVVYDLNENKQKVMDIPIIENKRGTSAASKLADISEDDSENSEDESPTVRSTSPPKLETPISQIRGPMSRVREETQRRGYSLSQSEATTLREQTDLMSSDSGSSSSEQTSSWASSQSYRHGRLTRSPRDLEWARKVITRQSTHSLIKSLSGAEMDGTFNTPPSGRR